MSYGIDLSNQVALITGSGKGIGAEIASVLASAGATVIINDIMDEEMCIETLNKISQIGPKPYYIKCDISNEYDVKNMIETVKEKFGRLDIIVNNAVISVNSGASYDKMFAVNVKGVAYVTENSYTLLKESKGKIVNIVSASVFMGRTDSKEYVSTKAGVYGLSMFYAKHYAKDGIRVNAVAPAVVVTDLMIKRYGSKEAILEHYTDKMPLGRVGYPKDTANVALFLVSHMSDMLTGEVLFVDGGRMHIGHNI